MKPRPGRLQATLLIYQKLIGKKFNKWTVRGVVRDDDRWKVYAVCECLATGFMALERIKSGRSKGCRECWKDKVRKK